MSHETRYTKAKSTATYTLVVIVLLAVSKVTIGLISGSIALLADGIHSLSDVLIASLALIAVSVLTRKPSLRFPYGYYKVEDFVVLVISIIFMITSITLVYESVIRLLSGIRTLRFSSIAIVTAFLAGAVSIVVALRQERIAKEMNISSLFLNAKEMKYDAFASWLVALSILLSTYMLLPFEEIVTIVIATLIMRIALMGMKGAILNLLDVWEKPELIKRIREVIESYEDIERVKVIRLRKAGPLVFGDAIIEVKSHKSLEEIHDLLDKIESEVKEKIPSLSDIIIHAEPALKKELKVIIPVNSEDAEEAFISEHFGRAPLLAYVVVDVRERNFRIISIQKNPFSERKAHAGIKLAKMLGDQDVDIVIVKNIGEASFMALKGLGIKIYKARKEKLTDAIIEFMSGDLKILEKPTKEE